MTTCYVAGEYDILAVSLQPFTGDWQFAFKRNIDLTMSPSPKYTLEQRKYLLATSETITFPLASGWTSDLFSLLTGDLGEAHIVERTNDEELLVVRPPKSDEQIVVQEPSVEYNER